MVSIWIGSFEIVAYSIVTLVPSARMTRIGGAMVLEVAVDFPGKAAVAAGCVPEHPAINITATIPMDRIIIFQFIYPLSFVLSRFSLQRMLRSDSGSSAFV
jgi:hypothetical protein